MISAVPKSNLTRPMKKILLSLSLILLVGTCNLSLRAADAAATNAPPAPTLEQRIAGLEAYLGNTDPTTVLKTGPKDKDGNPTIPEGLTTPSIGVAGPGHNAWQMTS